MDGLSFFRNRFYDQETGRWTQEDPIGLAGGLNLYAYVGNNPVAYTDPFGLRADTLKVPAAARPLVDRCAQSATCASLIGQIQQSEQIVSIVVADVFGRGDRCADLRGGCIIPRGDDRTVPRGASIFIQPGQEDAVFIVGHEFQHAVEIIEAAPCGVSDPETCAREVEDRIREELK